MNKFLKWIKSPKSDRSLLIVILILLNLVSARAFLRIDLTSQKSFSISKASKDVIKHLDSPLSIKVFFSKNLPSPYNNVELYLTDILAEYKTNASKNFSYQVYDMDKQENQNIAEQFGLGPVQIDNIGTSEFSTKIAWMGLAITYGDFIATLDSLKTTNDIEYKITTTISKIINAQTNHKEKLFEIGYITGHRESPLQTNRYAQNYSDTGSGNLRTILSDIYEIKQIDLKSEDIPNNLKAIIVNNPKSEFSQEELLKIDDFILKGGNAIFFVDPLVELSQGPNSMPIYQKPQTNIFELLGGYGINIENAYIMDEHCFTQNQSGFGKQVLSWAPIVAKSNLAKKNPITQNLGGLIFFCNGPIDVTQAQNNNNLKTTVLATSSKQSWTQNQNIILYPGYILPPEDASLLKQQNLAVLVEGKFDSAFSNLQNRKSLTENSSLSKIIVVSSGTVATDTLIDREGNEPIALFIRNAIDYINENPDFCTMRTKGTRLDFISIKSERFATVIKLINEFGLAFVAVIIGFIVWRMRLARRYFIHQKYNYDDKRIIEKKSNEVKK